MTPRIETALLRLREAESALKKAVRRQQLVCKHKVLAECAHLPFASGGCLPPMRVCITCGMTEDGWGPGYIVLKSPATPIARDDLYKIRQGLSIDDGDKGPLLRRETTVRDMVNGENKNDN